MADPESFTQNLRSRIDSDHAVVAFSGGLDSTVLLHALARAEGADRIRYVRAVHVHHGLHPDADRWTEACAGFCAALSVPLEILRLAGLRVPGASLEATAREARYTALRECLGAGEVLCTAHHLDDQAETVLLRLLRGAGIHGLTGIDRRRRFGPGYLVRPLLEVPRQTLRDYARVYDLRWCEDPSNRSLRFDRNYLRHEVMPRLSRRWPASARVIARTAEHLSETGGLLDDLAGIDLKALGDDCSETLSVPGLRQLSPARRHNLVRFWIRGRGFDPPSTAQLRRLEREMLGSRDDRMPCITWPGVQLRRYRERLYLMAPLPEHDNRLTWAWNLDSPLRLPGVGIELSAERIRRDLEIARPRPVRVGFRRGGERCRPVGRDCRKSLKALFQERGVPPWLRDRVPLVFVDGELRLVVDYWTCEADGRR